MVRTRNERLCPCQQSSATGVPFVLKMSHNTKERSELTGRNKIEIAGIAEKRIARTLRSAWRSRNSLKKLKAQNQNSSTNIATKDPPVVPNSAGASDTQKASFLAAPTITSNSARTKFWKVHPVDGSRNTLVSSDTEGDLASEGNLLLFNSSWISSGKVLHREYKAKLVEDYTSSKVTQTSKREEKAIEVARGYVLGAAYTECIKDMRQIIDSYKCRRVGIAERRLTSIAGHDKGDELQEVDGKCLPAILSRNTSCKITTPKDTQQTSDALRSFKFDTSQAHTPRPTTVPSRWHKKPDYPRSTVPTNLQRVAFRSNRAASALAVLEPEDAVAPHVQKLEIRSKGHK